jgi:TonB-dependent receptor
VEVLRRIVFIGLSLACVFLPATAASQEAQEVEEIVVYGSRAALESAINKQRDSDKVVGVVDSDAMGNFADFNVAESVRRVPGILVENDQGEGRYVSIRGMNTDLNAMTINGVSTMSPEDRRGVILDGVPSDMLDSITVYKTLTSDMDLDNIGGSVDLQTISAFKYSGFHAKVKLDTLYNELSSDASNPKYSLTASNRFDLGQGDELGAVFVYTNNKRRIVAHNNENGGWGDAAPNDDYELRFYDLERDREGFVLNLDYLNAKGNLYYVRMFYNDYVDAELRNKFEIRDVLEDYEPAIDGDSFIYAAGRMDNEGKWRIEERTIESYQAGAELELGEGTLSLQAYMSNAEQDDTDRTEANFRTDEYENVVTTYDNGDPKKPVIVLNSVFYDASNYPLDGIEKEFALTTDEESGFRADYEFAYNDLTTLKAGLKIRMREKNNDFVFCGYEPDGDAPILASYETHVPGPYLNTPHGPAPTARTVQGFQSLLSGSVSLLNGKTCPGPGSTLELSGDENEETLLGSWNTEEEITAIYAMATTSFDNGSIAYGLRYEQTDSTYSGVVFNSDDESAQPLSYSSDYGFLSPSVNLKYNLDDDKILRFGIFKSLVRPGFSETKVGADVRLEDNEIRNAGNPELDPTEAWNLDATYEWYMDQSSLLGANFFYKRIDNTVAEVRRDDFAFRGRTWDEARTFVNIDQADLIGVELYYQTNFDNGMLVLINYTFTSGDMRLPADADAASEDGGRDVPYFKQSEGTGNFVIGYDKNQWDVRLAFNYRDSYLDELGDTALQDRYTDVYTNADLTVKYEVSDKLTIRGAALNLLDSPEYYYFGNAARLSQYDEYGVSYELGFRYKL